MVLQEFIYNGVAVAVAVLLIAVPEHSTQVTEE
jgi:hypothetical protein